MKDTATAPMISMNSVIDPDRFAALLCDWCLEAREGQQILIETTTLAAGLAAALHRALLDRGAWPHLRIEPPQLAAQFYEHARPEQLDTVPSLSLAEIEHVDATLRILAPATANPLEGVDPELTARSARAQALLREARTQRRWALSLYPSAGLAQLAEMPAVEYGKFVNRALFLDRPDPLQAWKDLHEHQQRLVERLTPAHEVRIQSDRTDITLNVQGRTWVNSDGKRNMPSGEVFTSPHEGSANGTILFDVPSSGRGTPVAGVQVEFKDGQVVNAQAEVGDAALQAALNTDPGARRLGEIGIGTNAGIDRATGSTLMDEKIAGTIHLALGRSYREAGGVNDSALHWDLICDLRKGGTVTVDGEELIVDGQLRL